METSSFRLRDTRRHRLASMARTCCVMGVVALTACHRAPQVKALDSAQVLTPDITDRAHTPNLSANDAQAPAGVEPSGINGTSRKFRDCIATAGAEEAAGHACLQQELAYQDGVLNELYRERLAHQSVPDASALRQSQRNWLQQKGRECEALKAGTQAAHACRLQRTISRIAVLDADGSSAVSAGTQSAAVVPDAQGALALDTSGVSLSMTSEGCQRDALTRCTGAKVRITTPDVRGQLLDVPQVFFDAGSGAGTLYLGPLDQGFPDGPPAFIASDINGDGHDDLLVWSGRDGSYGDPSFDYFLYDSATATLQRNDALAELVEAHTVSRVSGGRLHLWYRSGPCERGEKIVEVKGNQPRTVKSDRRDICSQSGDAGAATGAESRRE